MRTERWCCCGRQSGEERIGRRKGGFQPLRTLLPNKAKLAGSADLIARRSLVFVSKHYQKLYEV